MEAETLATLANAIKDHLSLQSNASITSPRPPKQPFIIGIFIYLYLFNIFQL